MESCIYVGMGGFIGAVCRYLLSLIPLDSSFPFITLLTNFIGAVVIGGIATFSLEIMPLSSDLTLFLKTGVCGGFTTFSTFSLETVNLFENQHTVLGILYAFASILLCLTGVYLGKALIRVLF